MQKRETAKRDGTPQLEEIISRTLIVLPLMRKKIFKSEYIQEEFGMPLSHLQALFILNVFGPMPVSMLSARLGIAKPNTTPLVDRLVESGMVNRERSLQDRRVVTVNILPKGEKKLKEITRNIAGKASEDWFMTLSSNNITELDASLKKIMEIILI